MNLKVTVLKALEVTMQNVRDSLASVIDVRKYKSPVWNNVHTKLCLLQVNSNAKGYHSIKKSSVFSK